MKVEKIKFSKYFHPINPGEWIGMNIVLEEGEDALSAITKAREIAQTAYDQNQVNEFVDYREGIKKIQKEEKITGDLAHDISTCEDITVLQSYYLLMTTTHKHLMPVYEERKRQLVENETKEILRKSSK